MPRLPLLICTTALLMAGWGSAWAQPGATPAEAAPSAEDRASAAAAAEDAPGGPSAALPEALLTTEGRVAYYARKFAGRKTASGERHNPQALTMAHPTLPMGTRVRVTNLATQRSVVVRVNDRGPYIGQRLADVSEAAARDLRMLRAGVIHARLEVLR